VPEGGKRKSEEEKKAVGGGKTRGVKRVEYVL
jgi:hypothetical protein